MIKFFEVLFYYLKNDRLWEYTFNLRLLNENIAKYDNICLIYRACKKINKEGKEGIRGCRIWKIDVWNG